MNAKTRRELKYADYVLVAFLISWGFLIFFENAWFAAPAFGVTPPSWAAWVGGLSFTTMNLIDTVGVGAVAALLVISYVQRPKVRRSTRGSSSVFGVVLLLLGLLLVLFLLSQMGLTLSSLVTGARHFLGF